MRKLIALCLLLCVMPLVACETVPIEVITNEVPASLLEPEPEPAPPNVNTGDDTTDYKNATAYLEELKFAFRENYNKLLGIKELVNDHRN